MTSLSDSLTRRQRYLACRDRGHVEPGTAKWGSSRPSPGTEWKCEYCGTTIIDKYVREERNVPHDG